MKNSIDMNKCIAAALAIIDRRCDSSQTPSDLLELRGLLREMDLLMEYDLVDKRKYIREWRAKKKSAKVGIVLAGVS